MAASHRWRRPSHWRRSVVEVQRLVPRWTQPCVANIRQVPMPAWCRLTTPPADYASHSPDLPRESTTA